MSALSKLEVTWPRLKTILHGVDRKELDPLLVIYTDGSCYSNGKRHARAGFGVYISDGCKWNASEPLPAGQQSNQRAELCAMLWALLIARKHPEVIIISDSTYAINSSTVWREERKYGAMIHPTKTPKRVKYADVIDAIGELLEERQFMGFKLLEMRWVKGHEGVPGNEKADQLAKQSVLSRVKLPKNVESAMDREYREYIESRDRRWACLERMQAAEEKARADAL